MYNQPLRSLYICYFNKILHESFVLKDNLKPCDILTVYTSETYNHELDNVTQNLDFHLEIQSFLQ